ncbi:CaiB/BaiF CoA transferase family protein [Acinetobacter soli]|uniref:CaiB/BaiF CoA transferase family protein n=1 Tax=Acinetobacter soli TaxID=487316 RepID=UPI000DD0936D|nr:CaiB/BaiF CoA-transferase family protein [Acinetobacter soli]MBO3672571.1 CoA transferase [Acinetobacter soli]RSB51496.1 CoA transferase [Acinetobacter soli]
MNTPLAGLRVLDFSTLLPGPFATLYLADLGADVIHIESPTRPDLVRIMPPYANGQATAHSYLNRNKQSITLDLKDRASIEKIYAKIQEVDIVVEQFRPGVMTRLGLDYATLSALNPALIYCSITGYGQTGTYRDRAGHDINYVALSGIAGYGGRKASGPPPMGIQIADVAGGSLHAVIGILTAVIERSKSGLGQHVDISMTDCAAGLNAMSAAATLAAEVPSRAESEVLNGGSFYDYYETADGRYFSIGGLEPQFIQALAVALDLPILAQKAASFLDDDRLAVKAALKDKIKSKTWEQWREIFASLDVCAEPVLYLEEALNSELAVERNWSVEVPLASDSEKVERQLACPIKFSRSEAQYRFTGQTLGAGRWD